MLGAIGMIRSEQPQAAHTNDHPAATPQPTADNALDAEPRRQRLSGVGGLIGT